MGTGTGRTAPASNSVPGLVRIVIPNRGQRGRLGVHQVTPLPALLAFAQEQDKVQCFLRQRLGQELGLFVELVDGVHADLRDTTDGTRKTEG